MVSHVGECLRCGKPTADCVCDVGPKNSVLPEHRPQEFVDDWNSMVATVSALAAKYDLPKPDMLFNPKWLYQMNDIAHGRLTPVIIYMGVRIRFGTLEQRDVIRTI